MSTINDYAEPVREPVFPNAKQIKITDVLGENIVVKDIKELDGDNGVYLIVLATFKSEEVSFANGSKVVIKQLQEAKKNNKLPMRAMIKKVKNKDKSFSYYTLSPPEAD